MDTDNEGGPTGSEDTARGAAAAKKGKSKPSKGQDRKAQNRIAQREFRQRKQAYVKELEAKAAMMELSRDEQFNRFSEAFRTLLEENQKLRTMLQTLSGFIGEGLGGALAKVGTDLPEFHAFITRSRIDTATDALRLTKPQLAPSTAPRQFPRPGDSPVPDGDVDAAPPSKRQRETGSTVTATEAAGRGELAHVYASTSALPPPPPPFSSPQPPSSNPAQAVATSPPLSQPPVHQFPCQAAYSTPFNPSPSFAYAPDPAVPAPPPLDPPHSHQQPRLAPIDTSSSTLQPGSRCGNLNKACDFTPEQGADILENLVRGDMDLAHSKMAEILPSNDAAFQAIQLIAYHMRCKRDNPAYTLPPSLSLTNLQRSVPHPPFFDGIIFPSLRDRLILLKDQLELPTLIEDFSTGVSVNGDDSLAPESWELSEEFIRKYWYVVDQDTLSITNKWRKERGEKEFSLSDLIPRTS
ncbi:transcription factor [Rhodotorula toruloides]|uniref:Transcription factor n=1 Tax=Rhodotorula toruloides TaxID=5286 RepID=A0A511KJV1_RHOTO|nr:transcription factor [Rhodotorula toruloides]